MAEEKEKTLNRRTAALLSLLTLFIVCGVVTITAEAMDIPPSDDYYDAYVEFSIHMDVPDGFRESVDVYLDNTPFVVWYNEDRPYNGYYMDTYVLPGKYDVHVISRTDSLNVYLYDYPETFDTDETRVLNITAYRNPQYVLDHDEIDRKKAAIDANGGYIGEPENTEQELPIPSEYDYSEGEPYGTLHVKCKTYGLFESVTLRLLGAGHVYDIVLYVDNGFEAYVKLPVGTYSESTTFKYTYDDWSEENFGKYDFSYMWRHQNNTAVFGNVYEIKEDETTELDDLIVYVNYDNGIGEVDLNILIDPIVQKEKIETRNEAYEKKLNEAFPDRVQETEPEETVAPAPIPEPIEESAESHAHVAAVIAVIAAFVLAAVIIAVIRSRKKY